MQHSEQLYSYDGLKPLTRKQIIDYMKDGNHLTKREGKYFLTGGIPVYKEVKGVKKLVKVLQRGYSGYDEYFNSLVKDGLITKAFV